MAAAQNTIVTHHADGTTTTEVVDWTAARVAAYPSTGDQFDMQYHDAVDGTTTWEDAIAQVKTDNPKPA
jgi:hypothetical protein